MSDPITASEEDYRHNTALMDAAKARISDQGIAERWSNVRLEKTLIDGLLPYYRAQTDPASSAAILAWQQDYIDRQKGDAVRLDPTQYPELTSTIAEQTRLMNAFHEVTYASPAIIIVDGLSDEVHTPLQFDYDAVLIDKDYFATHAQDPLLAGGIAHELAHRYQRSDDELRLGIKLNVLREDATDPDKVIERMGEAEADFNARRVLPTGVMSRFMQGIYLEEATTVGYFVQLHPELDAEELLAKFTGMKQSDRKQLVRDAIALPDTQRDVLYAAGVRFIDETASDDEHPKIHDRLRLQAALDQNGAILSCHHVTLTDSAMVLDATDCGPRHVPLIVDGVPTGEKLRQ